MTEEKEKITRRKYLKYGGAGVAVAVVAVAGYGAYEVLRPKPKPKLTIAWWGGSELDALKPTIEEFKTQTGSEVEIILHGGGGSAGTIPRIAAAWPEVVIDIIGISTHGALKLAGEGYSIPLTAADIPELKDYPEDLYIKYDGETRAVVFATVSVVIVYRNDKVKEPIKSFHDLLRPELKGRVAVGTATGGAGMYFLSWALDFGGDEYNVDSGFDALKRLGEMGNLAMIWSEEPYALTAMEAGDIWAMEFSDYGTGGWIARKAAAGEYPYLAVVKNPAAGKSVYDGDTLAIINGPRKELAKQFARIFLRADMQEKFAPVCGEAPSNPMTPVDPVLAPWINSGAELKKYGYFADRAQVVKNIDEWASRFDKEIRPLVKA